MRQNNERIFLLQEQGVEHTKRAFNDHYSSLDELRAEAKEKGVPVLIGTLAAQFADQIADQLRLPGKSPLIGARLHQRGDTYTLASPQVRLPIHEHLFRQQMPYAGNVREFMQVRRGIGAVTLDFEVAQDSDLIIARARSKNSHELMMIEPVGLDVTRKQAYSNIIGMPVLS